VLIQWGYLTWPLLSEVFFGFSLGRVLLAFRPAKT
jgi:hypothetical protein